MELATAIINTSALRHNLRRIRALTPHSKQMAVVKANAYGHGVIDVAQALHDDADALGVARLPEAVHLREAGITLPILLLEGVFCPDELRQAAALRLQIAVHSPEQLAMLEAADLAAPLTVWLKIDTGMHRLGVPPAEAEAFWQRLCRCANVAPPVNFLTHFSRADEPQAVKTAQQIACFDRVTAGKAGLQSLAASAGIVAWPQAHRDWVRPGLLLYGVSPLAQQTAAAWDLRPVMRLQTRVIAVRPHAAGEPVGYGDTWTSPRATRLGVLGIGYGDGYPRDMPSGTPVWLNGREVPLVGRVSMDMLCVDLGPQAQDKPGDTAVLWGPELAVEKVAAVAEKSPYELVTRLTSRVTLHYRADEE